jgi:pimeloyl-ACP methyl ester carboxylesterase
MIEVVRDGRRVVVEATGAGRAVVCVPGIGDTRATWRALVPRLVETGHRVYTMDLRGHGASDVGFPSYTAADIGDDVAALLDQEDLREAALIGNSIGGAAVCRAAVTTTGRVGQLVLVNPFVRDMPAERWLRPLVPFLFADPWGAWAWGQYRKTLFVTRPADHATNRAAVLDTLREPGRMAAVRGMLRASKADIAARLGELDVPVLVVMGANDPDYPDPTAEGETLRALIPGVSAVEVLEETGHYPQIERADAFAQAVLAHLPEVRRAS